jgi:outer membrane protein
MRLLSVSAVTLLILAGPWPSGVSAQPAQPLSLREAVTRALARNPELAQEQPGLEAARLEARAARAGYYPKLDFEQNYAGGNNPVFVFGTLLTQHAFTEANFYLPSLNNPEPIDNLQTRITVQQNIWDFGRTRSQVDAMKLGVEVADRGYDEHRQQVILGVLDAYYSLSLARDVTESARIALESAEAIEKQARARVASGLATEADLLRSQAHLAGARQHLIQAQGQVEIAKANLNRIMGESLDAEPGQTAALTPVKLELQPEETLLAGFREKRPDYQRLLAELHQAETEVGAKKTAFLPTIGAYGTWEADNPSFSNAGGTNWVAALSLRWNVYAGGADEARLKAARQRLEQKQRQVAAMESAMALQIRRALIQCRSMEQQVEVTRAAEAQSQESLRILKNRYEAGLATMTDILAAETERSAARTSLAEAVYRHRLSYAQLEHAAGTLSESSQAVNP